MSEESIEYEVLMYGEREARWYQVAGLHAVEEALEQQIMRTLVVLPTGCGKTLTSGLIFSSIRVRKALGIPDGRPLRLLFVAHKHRLLTQAEQDFANAVNVEFIPHSAFSRLTDEQIQRGWDICCIDEAHHEAMSSIQYQLEKIGDRPIIGLTATPDRADGLLIKFEKIIEPISREDAVAQGYLAPTFLNSIVDTTARDKVPTLKSIINKYGHEMGRGMIFLRTKAEVRALNEWLVLSGYSSVAILDQSEAELNRILDDFSDGRYQFVVNCNKINEGVDVQGCDTVILGRTFGSYPQLNQVIGRAARPDSACNVWELINPLSGRNLDTTVVVGTPERHRLIFTRRGEFVEEEFDYVHRGERAIQSGIRM
jgi:superfamily II DNA or RNA helicase